MELDWILLLAATPKKSKQYNNSTFSKAYFICCMYGNDPWHICSPTSIHLLTPRHKSSIPRPSYSRPPPHSAFPTFFRNQSSFRTTTILASAFVPSQAPNHRARSHTNLEHRPHPPNHHSINTAQNVHVANEKEEGRARQSMQCPWFEVNKKPCL